MEAITSQQMCRAQSPDPGQQGSASLHRQGIFPKDRGLGYMPKGETRLTTCTEAASFSMKGNRL